MTPSVPGKAYFIAENQRHKAASSPSVNSYPPESRDEATVFGGADALLSGKRTTFVIISDTSSTSPPMIETCVAADPIPSPCSEPAAPWALRIATTR